MKSQFESILVDDCKEFNELFDRYKKKRIEDLEELHNISTMALILAQRWCEVQSNASIISKQAGASKTDFQQWAYQHYRNLQEMHIDCRSLYKCAREDLKANLLMEN